MTPLTRIAEDFGAALLLVAILLVWEWWRERHETPPGEDNDLGERIDLALSTYSDLVDNDCRDATIMEIARDRVEQLRRQYEDSEIRKLGNTLGNISLQK